VVLRHGENVDVAGDLSLCRPSVGVQEIISYLSPPSYCSNLSDVHSILLESLALLEPRINFRRHLEGLRFRTFGGHRLVGLVSLVTSKMLVVSFYVGCTNRSRVRDRGLSHYCRKG
jgi:hypothetical protein